MLCSLLQQYWKNFSSLKHIEEKHGREWIHSPQVLKPIKARTESRALVTESSDHEYELLLKRNQAWMESCLNSFERISSPAQRPPVSARVSTLAEQHHILHTHTFAACAHFLPYSPSLFCEPENYFCCLGSLESSCLPYLMTLYLVLLWDYKLLDYCLCQQPIFTSVFVALR